MKFEELKLILKRLYKEYIVKHLKRIFLALALSILVAGSTSSIAWLLDPAVKKIFVEQDRTLAWLIPLTIILAVAHNEFKKYTASDFNHISKEKLVLLDIKGIYKDSTWKL